MHLEIIKTWNLTSEIIFIIVWFNVMNVRNIMIQIVNLWISLKISSNNQLNQKNLFIK